MTDVVIVVVVDDGVVIVVLVPVLVLIGIFGSTAKYGGREAEDTNVAVLSIRREMDAVG